MAAVTFTIEPDELRGLTALAALHGADASAAGASGTAAGASDTAADAAAAVLEARALLRTALSDRLARAGLPWAPSADAVRRRVAPAASPATAPVASPAASPVASPVASQAAAPVTATVRAARRPARGVSPRLDVAYALAVAVAVILWGGYAKGWAWTGFRANGQLWDWLNLLLLPVVIGVIPLWIQYRRQIGRLRTAIYWAFLAAWTGFMIAGYVVPIGWTGFRGQTLWNWISLLLLPAALAVTMALTSTHVHPARFLRSLHPYQLAAIAVLAAGWVVTVIGGYALGWTWTGYTGNTLWDWLQLLLLPALVPTVLLPALLNWITGDPAARAAASPVPVPAQASGGEVRTPARPA